jgi:hypothetical protein
MTLQSLFEELERSVLMGDPGRVIAAADKSADGNENEEEEEKERMENRWSSFSSFSFSLRFPCISLYLCSSLPYTLSLSPVVGYIRRKTG